MDKAAETETLNFIEQIITDDLEKGKHKTILTRFPPEPNGYLHIGHCKAICINFMTAEKFGGSTNLRFDDTNPVAEKTEYVDSIKKDIEWLGFKWNEPVLFTSDYFGKLHELAVKLIKDGKAYVDDSTQEEIRRMRGVPTKSGEESPFRNRSAEENLELFAGMKNGDFEEGSKVLRAKVDMTSSNMHMRDPIIYRILKAHHHRTGDEWCIYPMYDFAHGSSDSIEGITHSLCSLEFENHRPLYEWLNSNLEIFEPQQIEFARLNLSYTIMSKRKLISLVEDEVVAGWDDPRMPTISGMRRRGYTPDAIKNFIDKVGVAKRENIIDVSLLEFCVREDLNKKAPRVMGVLNPLKVTITNYPEGQEEELTAINNPEDPSGATREIPFSNTIFIEKDDFMEDPPKKYFRLAPEKVVRLKNAYIIQCNEVIKDDAGEIIELKCSYFDNSKSGEDNSGIKVKGVIHWVAEKHAVEVEVRNYDRLFLDESPDKNKNDNGELIDFREYLNPNSKTIGKALVEPSLKDAKVGETFQFMRKGYYCVDPDSTDEKLVFNLTVPMRDGWAKKNKK